MTKFSSALEYNGIVDEFSGVSWQLMYGNLGRQCGDDDIAAYKERLKSYFPAKKNEIVGLYSEYSMTY